jgi:serine phosphatase RsbU (regulator of sigma subunit)
MKARTLRNLYLAVGLAGFAIAVASIADMFVARPYDGVVPYPYGQSAIVVREVVPGSGAAAAGIRPDDRIEGIGGRIVRSPSDATAELAHHKIGETVSYLVRHDGQLPEIIEVRLGGRRLGGSIYLYYALLGFLFFLIGLLVFAKRPNDRAARVFFMLCVLFLVFFVCRLRPSSYWWIDVFVQNTGTISLFLLPAVFLHFFLVFPEPKRLSFARPDEWTEEPPPRWKVKLQEFLSGSPQLFALIYSVPPVIYVIDLTRQMAGHRSVILSGAPLTSWVLLGDYLVLGLLALAHSAYRLEDPLKRRQVFQVFVGTILGTVPFLVFSIILPSVFNNDAYVFYGIVPMVLIPLTFGYAIVRFQLMNVRVIVRRSLVYTVITAVIFALYAGALAAANQIFKNTRFASSPLFFFGFFLILIPLFEFLRRRLQVPLDRLFFREKHDYQTAILEMSGTVAGELDLARVADFLTDRVVAAMRLAGADLYLREHDGTLARRGRREDRLSPVASLRARLRSEGEPQEVGTLRPIAGDQESRAFCDRVREEGFRLLVPLVYRGRLMGILLLKPKLSEQDFDRDDLNLLATLANQAALAIETALLHDEMTRQAEFRRDLEIARDIQTSLFPRSVPQIAGLRFFGGSLPARVVGGDFYDFIRFDGDSRLGFVIGDVSGKSIPASLLMVASKEIVYARAQDQRDPGLLFRESNRRIYEIKRRMFVSLGYFMIDPAALSMRYAIGGQPLPILIRPGDGGPTLIEAPQYRLPLGAFREVPYDTREIYLRRGDLLFFYTDGFTEAMNPTMDDFGEDRLMESLSRHAGGDLEEVARGIMTDIRRFAGEAEQYDDMTFMLMKVGD